ncbi:MAG: rhomboid family intramembrane serine protease [Bacteroidota bacterium]|nr:rhomboid family intramembrane serine protease [Bacteroidota bacterium]
MSIYQYQRPQLFPPVVKNLLIINGLVFVAQVTFGSSHPYTIENLFALHDVHSVFFQPFQLITYMFLHGSFDHIFGNMLAVWVFGGMLENYWGGKKFLTYYLVTGVGAGLLHLGVLYLEMNPIMEIFRTIPEEEQLNLLRSPQFKINVPTLGASGAVFGCLAGAGILFPNDIIRINFIFPVKIKWLVIVYTGIELLLAIRNSAGDAVAHFAHLGGAITGLILLFIWNKTKRKTLY